MEYSRVKSMLDTPSLETMTKSALKIVSKNQNGFFLMVRIGMYRNVLLSIVDERLSCIGQTENLDRPSRLLNVRKSA